MILNPLKNNKGYTLVEIMIGFLILSIVMGFTLLLLGFMGNAYGMEVNRNENKIVGDYAFSFIEEKLRFATAVAVEPEGTMTPKYENIIWAEDGILYWKKSAEGFTRNALGDVYDNKTLSYTATPAEERLTLKITISGGFQTSYQTESSIKILSLALKSGFIEETAPLGNNPVISYDTEMYSISGEKEINNPMPFESPPLIGYQRPKGESDNLVGEYYPGLPPVNGHTYQPGDFFLGRLEDGTIYVFKVTKGGFEASFRDIAWQSGADIKPICTLKAFLDQEKPDHLFKADYYYEKGDIVLFPVDHQDYYFRCKLSFAGTDTPVNNVTVWEEVEFNEQLGKWVVVS